MRPARGSQTKEYTELMSCQCNAEQVQAKQSTHCPQVLCAKHLWTMSVLLWFVLLCFAFSVLPTSKAKRSGLRQFLRGYPRFALLCLANLEGQAKWAKAIFEGVPRLRHPGLGTLATSNPGRQGLGTLV